MGAYKSIQELWRKKQLDVMRFLLRVRCWQYRQLSALHRAPQPTRPDNCIRVRCAGRKRPVPKGATYGKPVNHGVNLLKFARSLQSVAVEHAGRRCGALRVLNSYWVGGDSTYKFFLQTASLPPERCCLWRVPWCLHMLSTEGKLRGKGFAMSRFRTKPIIHGILLIEKLLLYCSLSLDGFFWEILFCIVKECMELAFTLNVIE
uniref:Ribosomal protein L15 n=1 Tax=Pelusios castaneus TaxID=367368 RepID=A0A8C8SU38_9SAUR